MDLIVRYDDKTVQEIKNVAGYWYWTKAQIADILAYDYEEEEALQEKLEKYGLTFDELVERTVDSVSVWENSPDIDDISGIADRVFSDIKDERDQEENEEED